MLQKPLNLLTMDTLTLEHCYTRPTEKAYTDLIGAFRVSDDGSCYTLSREGVFVKTDSYVRPKLMRTVKSIGVSIELNVLKHLDLRWNSTLPEIAEQYPKVHKGLA